MNLLKLQDQLKGMPDAYLAQMVQQPDGQVPQFLVLGELQRRKDMRDAAQQQPETSVAEDMVQEGLGALQEAPEQGEEGAEEPEQIDQGIAAIPTDMEEVPAMAGGGIIAFADGDLVQNKNWRHDWSKNQTPGQKMFTLPSGETIDPNAPITQEAWLAMTPEEQELYKYNPIILSDKPNTKKNTSSGSLNPFKGKSLLDVVSSKANNIPAGPTGNNPVTPPILRGGQTQFDPLSPFKGNTLLDVVGPRGGYVPTTQDLAPTSTLTEAEAIANAQRDRLLAEIGGGMYTPTPKPDRGYPAAPSYPTPKITWSNLPSSDARFEELKREIRSPEEAMAEYRRLVGEDKGLAGLKDKISQMEEKAKGEEERAPWMALVRAGLGMAAGTSPFALTNIGAGGLEGLKDYQAAQDRIKAAEERRFDVQTKLAQAERAEQIAAAKYGIDSRQADQAREDKRLLEKLKAGLDIDTANAKGRFEAEKGQAMIDVDLAQLAETSRYHQAAIAAEREKTNIVRESGLETKRQQQATNLLKVIMQPMIAQAKASMGLTDEEAYDQVFPLALQKLPANMKGALGYDEASIKSLSGPTGPRKKPLSAFEK